MKGWTDYIGKQWKLRYMQDLNCMQDLEMKLARGMSMCDYNFHNIVMSETSAYPDTKITGVRILTDGDYYNMAASN